MRCTCPPGEGAVEQGHRRLVPTRSGNDEEVQHTSSGCAQSGNMGAPCERVPLCCTFHFPVALWPSCIVTDSNVQALYPIKCLIRAFDGKKRKLSTEVRLSCGLGLRLAVTWPVAVAGR